ncbi:hypothetical protein [Ciceribacter sp. L1K22]|uniref:hypothetical protein n=1 Tax=Ciceribacter sp. L1K22 TaxID=2820275 RepID=UPI001ABDA2BE|nr:hypothetical protein [Ciceribacter sp. L1K22]MBO3760345.1 hypothetical protein [Ciceribacter sp. L1K22]
MATMIDIDDCLSAVLRYAPSASDIVARRCLIEAARSICDRLKNWRITDEMEITTPEMQGVVTAADVAIVSIEAAELEGRKLDPITVIALDDRHPGWSYDTELGQARYVVQLEPNTVSVYPRQEGTLKCRLVLKPSLQAVEIPKFLREDYGEILGRGAAGIILTEPNSENPQLGLDHRAWFENQLNRQDTKAKAGQHNAPLRTKGSYL